MGSVLLALDAVLGLYRNYVWTTKRESRLKRRNFDMILFRYKCGCQGRSKTFLSHNRNSLPAKGTEGAGEVKD